MEPSQTDSLQEQLNVMVSIGMDQPIETLIRYYFYLLLLDIRV